MSTIAARREVVISRIGEIEGELAKVAFAAIMKGDEGARDAVAEKHSELEGLKVDLTLLKLAEGAEAEEAARMREENDAAERAVAWAHAQRFIADAVTEATRFQDAADQLRSIGEALKQTTLHALHAAEMAGRKKGGLGDITNLTARVTIDEEYEALVEGTIPKIRIGAVYVRNAANFLRRDEKRALAGDFV